MADDLISACMLLTRLPVHRLEVDPSPASFARAIWAYPLVGAGVGAAGGGTMVLAAAFGVPAAYGAVCGLAATLLLTGALHEDGLADTADALGGSTRARKLEIMRDSRIGSFGALALMLAMAARIAAMAALPGGARTVAALAAAGALSRAAMLPLLLLPPARLDGLAAGLRQAGRRALVLGLALGATMAALVLPQAVSWRVTMTALLAGLGMAWLARRMVGGHTGDLLGATCVLSECAILGVLAAHT